MKFLKNVSKQYLTKGIAGDIFEGTAVEVSKTITQEFTKKLSKGFLGKAEGIDKRFF